MSEELAVRQGGSARIRVHALPGECGEIVKQLGERFEVVSVSRQYRDREPSQLVRVYVEVRL